MFENQYKADFHRWTSGPRRVLGDVAAAVLAQGSGSCSKPAPQTLKLFTLLLWMFTPLLMSGGSEQSHWLGNSGAGSPPSEPPLQAWQVLQPEPKGVQTWGLNQTNKKKAVYTELFCIPKESKTMGIWLFAEPAKLPLPAPVSASHFTTTSALLFYSPFKTAASLWFLLVGASIYTAACIYTPLLD